MPQDDETDTKHVCYDCVREVFLSEEIGKTGVRATCTYCGKKRRCFTLEEMADQIEGAFEIYYNRTSDQPDDLEYMMQRDKESSYDWERHGEPVVDAIANAAEIDEAIATDILEILEERHSDFDAAAMGEETEFDSDSYYEMKRTSDGEFVEEWRIFEQSLKTETRFFNKHAEGVLKSLFDGLAEHKTFDGKLVVVEAGPGKEIASLYRGRVFQSEPALEEALKRPDIALGPPPPTSARAGRMNAHGIAVFYGALDPTVALAEIRPPVGSRVMVGKFTLLKPLRLLDVEALKSVFIKGSIFDSGHIVRLARAKFLGRLSDRIARPVMPGDEPSDYLITQAIADYLATEAKLDGLIYPSAQTGGACRNVVLFHHAARVQLMQLPEGTELRAHTSMSTEEGDEADYWVAEEVPAERPKEPAPPSPFDHILMMPDLSESRVDHDVRIDTLQVELDSVSVQHVEAVQFTTQTHQVRRNRWAKRDEDF